MSQDGRLPEGTQKTTGVPVDLAKNEHYIYLGKMDRVLFLLHVIYAKRESELVAQMTGDVYNCLIHHSYLKRGQCIFVYNVYLEPPAGTPRVHPIYASHVSFRQAVIDDENLRKFFHALLTIPRPPDEETFIVSAVFEGGSPHHYDFRVMSGVTIPAIASVTAMRLEQEPLAPLQAMMSIKPVDHL